jgi:hypothetical protein
MRQRLLLLVVCSPLLAASSCSTSVPRPDADICEINVLKLHESCYNIAEDYDDNGQLIPNAKPRVVQFLDEAAMLAALNKNTCVGTASDGKIPAPQGWANIKTWIKNLRDEAGRAGH